MSKSLVQIVKFNRDHLEEVIDLLQDISLFNPKRSDHNTIWNSFISQKNVHSYVAILNDKTIGFGVLVLEKKIRGGVCGHVEDIVIDSNYRGLGVGKILIDKISQTAKKLDCYKITLPCKEHNVEFYKKCGFVISGQSMQIVY